MVIVRELIGEYWRRYPLDKQVVWMKAVLFRFTTPMGTVLGSRSALCAWQGDEALRSRQDR